MQYFWMLKQRISEAGQYHGDFMAEQKFESVFDTTEK
mgnify:CR=1 FL=1